MSTLSKWLSTLQLARWVLRPQNLIKGNGLNIDTLKAAGFVETTYEGQAGIFLKKTMPIIEMPYARAHIVDNEIVFDSDIALVEVVPDPLFPGGGVQLVIEGGSYVEEPVLITKEEGLALLRDAGVSC